MQILDQLVMKKMIETVCENTSAGLEDVHNEDG